MVVRKRKRMNKQLGKRTHGHGDKKNWKGKGVRGGLGRAGSHKHKFASYWDTFGVKYTLKAKKKGDSMNIEEINRLLPEWMEKKKVEKKGDAIAIDGKKVGIAKVLGKGQVDQKWNLTNLTVAKIALEKIQAAGGTVEAIKKRQVKGVGK